MKKPTRERLYGRLVRQRKADTFPASFNLINPSETKYDYPHVGSYAQLAGDLYAKVLIIWPDKRCIDRFNSHRGKPVVCTPLASGDYKWEPRAFEHLFKLMLSVGLDVGLPHDPRPAQVYIADAVPFIGMGAVCKYTTNRILTYTTGTYLAPLIELINPTAVISVGVDVTRALFEYYNPKPEVEVHLEDSSDYTLRVLHAPYAINKNRSKLFPVFHPDRVMQNFRKKGQLCSGFEAMVRDWRRAWKWIMDN